jgi:hypothetical protein
MVSAMYVQSKSPTSSMEPATPVPPKSSFIMESAINALEDITSMTTNATDAKKINTNGLTIAAILVLKTSNTTTILSVINALRVPPTNPKSSAAALSVQITFPTFIKEPATNALRINSETTMIDALTAERRIYSMESATDAPRVNFSMTTNAISANREKDSSMVNALNALKKSLISLKTHADLAPMAGS